ncbi:UNKNOWN [Stylonychia lemnae]|uniref:Chorein N-terminal domain-containing protein n=1 Tax=Stylonychia lemnae TaxID=5949 RepID=A0A077ZUG3_STYLE|nr:UNKNOWN [Stylonychia lemnae]|eukprot:CDW72111.1 UNKNOWN [Stylonychia lemnae]
MIEGLVTKVLKQYLYSYLQNFDSSNLKISLLRGRVDLKDLELNDKLLKNLPFPLKLKYGRIGSISIELPSFLQLKHPKIKVSVSDIFICLIMKPMDEWNQQVIFEEYQEDKQQTLQKQEEDSKYIFEEYKGDQEKMNKYVLEVIQNVQISIKRIYLRMEDPEYPYALGVLLPSIQVDTTDRFWNKIDLVKDPEIMFKNIKIQDFQIFLENDKENSQIDKIIKLKEFKDADNKQEIIQMRLQQHIDQAFSDEFNPDNILHKFQLDIRFQFILDKIRVLENNLYKDDPDIKISVMFGNMFDTLTEKNWLRLKVCEAQIHALFQFLTFTGLYNTYRLGVLRKIFERTLHVQSTEIQEYIQLYHQHLYYKNKGNTKKAGKLFEKLSKIEDQFRIDLIFMLRKANHYRNDKLRELESMKQRIQSKGLLSKIPFFGRKENEIQQDMLLNERQAGLSDEQVVKIKKIELGYGLIRHMYQMRYERGMKELEQYAQLKHDPYLNLEQIKENYVMIFEFNMPKFQFEIYDDQPREEFRDIQKSLNFSQESIKKSGLRFDIPNQSISDADDEEIKVEEYPQTHLPSQQTIKKRYKNPPFFDSVIEGLEVILRSESKPNYFSSSINLQNIFILDHYSPNKDLPFVIQTVISDTIQMSSKEKRQSQALEILYEISPKNSKVATQRLKFHNLGQSYIYANLSFAAKMLKLWTLIIARVNENFVRLIEKSPPDVRKDINRGSFYEEMLQKAIEKKQDEFYEILQNLAYGNYEPPSIDMDIKLISPKVIIYEKLLNDDQCIEQTPVTLIIDLGLIEASTNLIEKMKGYDYTKASDQSILYDTTLVKFGKLKVVCDYDLQIIKTFQGFQGERVSSLNSKRLLDDYMSDYYSDSRSQNWRLSDKMLEISNEINFGFELKTCLLNLSRKVTQSIFILQNLVTQGKFMTQFNLFANAPPPRPPEIMDSDLIQKDADANFETIGSEEKMAFDTAVEEVRQQYKSGKYDEAKKAVSVQINMIFSRMTISFKEINEELISGSKDIFDFEIQQIKGRLTFQPKIMMSYSFFIQKLLITYQDQDQDTSNFKYLILNPNTEFEDKILKKSNSEISPIKNVQNTKTLLSHYPKTKTQVSFENRYTNHNQDHFIRFFWETQEIVIDFDDFYNFYPEHEVQSFSNQLSICFTEIGDEQEMKINISHLRIVFIVPLLYTIVKVYADFMIDMYQIERLIKDFMAQKDQIKKLQTVKSFQTQRTKMLKKQNTKSNLFDSIAQDRDSTKKAPKTQFVLQSAYQDQDAQMKKLAVLKKLTNAKREQQKVPEAVKHIPQKDQIQEKRIVSLKVYLKAEMLEVLIPTNLHDKSSLCLKMGSSLIVEMGSRTNYLDLFMNDKWKTWISSTSNHGLISTNKFAEQQQQQPQKIYLLHPYELKIIMKSYSEVLSDSENYQKSEISYIGSKPINLSAGLVELNSYLILGQLFFNFLNEVLKLLKDIDDAANPKDSERKSELQTKLEEMEKYIMGQQSNQKRYTLEEILTNEKLLRNKVKKVQSLWLKGKNLALASIKRKDFFEFVQIFDIPGIHMHFEDNLSAQNLSLVTLKIDNVAMVIESREFDVKNLYRMENLFQIERITDDENLMFFKMNAKFSLIGLYFNKSNSSEESFIEEYPFQMDLRQMSPLSKLRQEFKSEQMLNINLTYGFAANIQRVIRTLLEMEENQRNMYYSQVQTPMPIHKLKLPTLENIQSKRQSSMNAQAFSPRHIGSQLFSTPIQLITNMYNIKEESKERDRESNNKIYQDDSISDKDESFHTARDTQVDISEVEFHNTTELDIRFCLSVYQDLLKKKQFENEHIYRLGGKEHKQMDMSIFRKDLEKNFTSIKHKQTKLPIKIDFQLEGFKIIKSIVLQRNGIFGYYLVDETKKKRDFLGNQNSDISCIVRITRHEQKIDVYFESSLIIFNNCNYTVKLHALNAIQTIEVQIRKDKVVNTPLTWFKYLTELQFINNLSHKEDKNPLLIKKIRKAFDPNVIRPNKNLSKTLKITETEHISFDIFYLKTKTNVGQFLVVFQPILTLHNLLFTEIKLQTPGTIETRQSLALLKTNVQQDLTCINPHEDDDPKKQIVIRHKAKAGLIYEKEMQINLKKVKKHKDCFFSKGFITTLNNTDEKDQTVPTIVQIVFEKVKQTSCLKETEYDNFYLRQIIYKKTKSIFFKIYAPYVAVNRTEECINILGISRNPPLMNPFSNILIAPRQKRIQIQIQDYEASKPFLINTIGISGTIQQYKNIKASQDDKKDVHSQDVSCINENIEIGTYISSCPHPYSRTKVIKFQPRYKIINQIGLVIVLKEEKSNQQTFIVPDDEITMNFKYIDPRLLRIRLINVEKETKKTERNNQNQCFDEEFKNGLLSENFKNLPDGQLLSKRSGDDQQLLQSFSNNKNLNDNEHLPSRREASMMDEGEAYQIDALIQLNADSEDRREVCLNQTYCQYPDSTDRSIWSYKFAVKDLDEFQISLPNQMNNMPFLQGQKHGWQQREDKFIVRVNISPSSENDATLYITFSYPCN